jgi:hypothetical protein
MKKGVDNEMIPSEKEIFGLSRLILRFTAEYTAVMEKIITIAQKILMAKLKALIAWFIPLSSALYVLAV